MTTKRIFFVFTMVMVFMTGTILHAMVSRTKIRQAQHPPRAEAKIPDWAAGTPAPLPEAVYTEESGEPESGQETITNNQKYYTPLSSPDDKNILLIGKDPTYSNFDTIVIVNVNEKEHSVRLIDLPRDIYIDYTENILSRLEEASIDFYHEKGSRKLNAAPVIGRKIRYSSENEKFPGKPDMNFLCDLIHEIFSVDMDDYLMVDTEGFREMVDYFGGVIIDVPFYMHYEDPTQDLYIHLEPGLQLLNGEQAEGFVRFRQSYTPDGRLEYYSRAENTFLFLKAFYQQHVTLKNLSRVGKVYEIVREHSSTSVRSIGDAYRYARLAGNIIKEEYTIESVTVECSRTKTINGVLYEVIRTE